MVWIRKFSRLWTSNLGCYDLSKEFSEGVPNPVFRLTPEPDFNPKSFNNDDNNNAPQVSIPPTTIKPTFNSLTSFEKQVSPKALSIISNALHDTEKGLKLKDLEKKSTTEYKGIKKYLGLLLTLSASFCFSLVVTFVKILKDYGFDPYGGSFWRYFGTIVPTVPLLLFYECGPGYTKQDSVFTGVWPVFKEGNWKTWLGLLGRGLIGSTAVILRYYALRYLTVGDTLVITFSTPVLVIILSHFFLAEKCGIFPIIVAFGTLCGVVIVAKPPILTGAQEFDRNTLIGTGFACASLLCSALIVILTRKIRKVHFTVTILVVGIIGVAQALVMTYFLGEFNLPREMIDSLMVAGVSVLSFLGQISIILALKFEQAGPVSLLRSCDVVFGFLFQYIFLRVIPDMFSLIGGGIVLASVLSIGFRKWLDSLPKDDKQRERWWFILK